MEGSPYVGVPVESRSKVPPCRNETVSPFDGWVTLIPCIEKLHEAEAPVALDIVSAKVTGTSNSRGKLDVLETGNKD